MIDLFLTLSLSPCALCTRTQTPLKPLKSYVMIIIMDGSLLNYYSIQSDN